jgi:AmmeMemoRadiSam system protein A
VDGAVVIAGAAGAREALLALARRALEAAVTGDAPPCAAGVPVFDQRAGAFVTLESGGQLRGCIGQLEPDRLGDVLVHCARAAALEDPRFVRVAPAELPQIVVELSVLTPLSPLADPALVEPGVHGLVVAHRGRRGVLLPQVAVEWGWSAEEFLCQTCRKAGLPEDAWRDGAKIFTFEAEIFGEPP